MTRLGAALLVALLASRAAGQPYDPRHRWRTLETEHFRVHFHEGLDALARRVAAAAERAHAVLVPAFAHAPSRRTEVVLSDETDDANGSATPLPYNTIRLYGVPPAPSSELGDERDWVEALVVHEYAHILHLDTVEGAPAAVNAVLGKLLVPSGLSPPLIIEGLAVLHEADGAPDDDGGRNHSALFDMYARALLADGPFPRLDAIVNQPLAWPGGTFPYLLGGRFFEFARERVGAAGLTAFSLDQGSQLWPYRLGTLAERHLGGDLPDLWLAFEAHLRGEADATARRVRQRPVTATIPLTARGWEVLHPRWLPDGSGLVYFDAGPHERSGLRGVTLGGADRGRLVKVEGNGTFALRGPTEAVVAITDVYEEFHLVGDLYLADLATGERRRLTWGERATDPDLAPDGLTVVYAAHLPGGEMALRRLRLDGGAPETILRRPGLLVSAPRVSPDGRDIALEVAENGRRDVALWRDGELTFVTDDDAVDLAPSWGPDGTLYFSSERTGIYDVYAYEPGAEPATPPGPPAAPGRAHASGRLRQVTNVETGAFEPQVSPDGRTLAIVGYSRRGYDLATLPLDRSTWLEPGEARPRALRGPEAPPPPEPGPIPERPYQAVDTLLPTFWLPTLGYDGAGMTVGALTGGTEVLLEHAYAAQAWWGLSSGQPGYDVQYLGRWMWPRLQLSSSRYVGTTPGNPELLEEEWTPLQASLTFTNTHLDHAWTLSAGWRALRLRSIGGVPTIGDPGITPYRNGTAGEWSVAFTFSDRLRFVESISPEEGRTFALGVRGADPALGGDFSYARARATLVQYVRVPWTRHVVLALRLAGGVAAGTLGGRYPFTVGGLPSPDLASLLLAPLTGTITVPGDQLRGYPSGAFGGSTLLNGNVELRFPIAAPELGYRAWPVELRRLHGAVFLDAGGAFVAAPADPPAMTSLDQLRFGAGAELRAEVVLGYYLRTDLRVGLARGLGALLGGTTGADPAITQLYLTLGSSF